MPSWQQGFRELFDSVRGLAAVGSVN